MYRYHEYLSIAPTGIQVGNLVEIQVSFCAVPIAKGKYKMLLKLRSVCVLDRLVVGVCVNYLAPFSH